MNSLVKGKRGARIPIEVTPESAGWSYLDFRVVDLLPGQGFQQDTAGREVAVVSLSGHGLVRVESESIELTRTSVFDEKPWVLYVPPGRTIRISTEDGFSCAVGGAPAEGGLPLRVFEPDEMRMELRGGGTSYRQISHILAAPLPAERLILYEVYVPRGTWSGWAPHCHDGYAGSPYLEETYYFRLQPSTGFVLHRNWREDEDFDEVMACADGDTALVPKGFHSSVACPGTNMYFLNYLAGELIGDERARGPHFHPDQTWIHDDWDAGLMTLPTAGSSRGSRERTWTPAT